MESFADKKLFFGASAGNSEIFADSLIERAFNTLIDILIRHGWRLSEIRLLAEPAIPALPVTHFCFAPNIRVVGRGILRPLRAFRTL